MYVYSLFSLESAHTEIGVNFPEVNNFSDHQVSCINFFLQIMIDCLAQSYQGKLFMGY